MEKITNREQEIIFTNWTDKDFEGQWNKKIYKLTAGKSYYLPFYLAEHFANYLINREMMVKADEEYEKELIKRPNFDWDAQVKLRTGIESRIFGNLIEKQKMIDKCVTIIPIKEEDINIVRTKEIIIKEVVLKRDLRGKELKERFPSIDVQINNKALKESEKEEFEN